MQSSPGDGRVTGNVAGTTALLYLDYLDRLAITLAAELRGAGVRALLLKGASFRDLLYDVDEVRWYGDVDLLVSRADVRVTSAVLAGRGFRDQYAGAGASETVFHAIEYQGESAGVDLHTSLPGITVSDEVAWDVLTARTERLELGGGEVEVLSPAARTMHLALHAAHDGTRNSRPINDVGRALQRLPIGVWDDAARLARELGALPAFVAGVRLHPAGSALVDALGLEVDIPTGVALRAGAPPLLAVGLDRLFTTRGVRAKAACLARELVPSPAGLRFWTPLARRGPLGLVAAYLWRPFYLLVHAPAAVVAWRRARRMTAGEA
jgi:hypothetical protein